MTHLLNVMVYDPRLGPDAIEIPLVGPGQPPSAIDNVLMGGKPNEDQREKAIQNELRRRSRPAIIGEKNQEEIEGFMQGWQGSISDLFNLREPERGPPGAPQDKRDPTGVLGFLRSLRGQE